MDPDLHWLKASWGGGGKEREAAKVTWKVAYLFQSLLASHKKKQMEKITLKFIDTSSKFGHGRFQTIEEKKNFMVKRKYVVSSPEHRVSYCDNAVSVVNFLPCVRSRCHIFSPIIMKLD